MSTTAQRGATVGNIKDALLRASAAALVVAQTLLGAPVRADSVRAPGPPRPAAVAVNRSVPKVTPPPLMPRFSLRPTQEELFQARVFGEPLTPVGGDPSPQQNAALARSLEGYLSRRACHRVY